MIFLAGIFNNSAHDDIPLHERDILEIAPPKGEIFDDDIPENYDARVVNFQSILETGKIQQESYTQDHPDAAPEYWKSQYIDWDSDDAFTRAIDQVKNATFERIQNSPELTALLDKDAWNRDDRVTWEREISTIVSEELDKIPGLNEYRLAGNSEKYPDTERRAIRLNDLSQDIENGTTTITFSCENMAAFEGVILQQAENHFLPDSAPKGDFKTASNYFYVVGRVNFSPEDSYVMNHAYIISSATANIIEAAKDPSKHFFSQYNENVNPDYSFEDFVRGEMAVHKNGSIYGGFNIDIGTVAAYRIKRGELDISNIYERTDPQWRNLPPLLSSDASSGNVAVAAAEGGEANIEQGALSGILDLAEIKARIEQELAELNNSGLDEHQLRASRFILETRLKMEFDAKVEELINSGEIYAVNEFLEEMEIAKIEAEIGEFKTAFRAELSELINSNLYSVDEFKEMKLKKLEAELKAKFEGYEADIEVQIQTLKIEIDEEFRTKIEAEIEANIEAKIEELKTECRADLKADIDAKIEKFKVEFETELSELINSNLYSVDEFKEMKLKKLEEELNAEFEAKFEGFETGFKAELRVILETKIKEFRAEFEAEQNISTTNDHAQSDVGSNLPQEEVRTVSGVILNEWQNLETPGVLPDVELGRPCLREEIWNPVQKNTAVVNTGDTIWGMTKERFGLEDSREIVARIKEVLALNGIDEENARNIRLGREIVFDTQLGAVNEAAIEQYATYG